MSGPASIPIAPDALDLLMPMHALVTAAGTIAHAGPTLAKIHPGGGCVGQPLLALFEPRRPRHIEDFEDICRLSGTRVTLRLRDPDRTPVIGVAVWLGPGRGVLINLSFGISVIDAVARFNLTGSDFAATDLTLELLYLVEANSAAMAESRKLNKRLHGAKIEAEEEALSDTLTGLRNRRALDQVLRRHLQRATPFALMHLDLDFFKSVNDTLGHAAGDRVLTEVARILIDVTRTDDVVARVGGDEFVIVFNGLTNSDRLAAIAARLIRRLEAPVPIDDREARISASIGIAISTDYDYPETSALMHDADVALYASKNHGRSRFTFHAPDVPAMPGAAPA